MNTQHTDQQINALSVSACARLLAKYEQQDTTAQNCGFEDYIDLLVSTGDEARNRDYSLLAYDAATYSNLYRYLYDLTSAENLLKCF